MKTRPKEFNRRTLPLEEFLTLLRAQKVPREHLAFVCPMCDTVQSIFDFTKAGLPPEEVEGQIGFSCIGRHTHHKPPPDEGVEQKGCNWTLGGLLRMHRLEVINEAGKPQAHFEPATPEQAQAHMRENQNPTV